MDKFKMKHPTNADFEEKLAKYAKLSDDVWRQASGTSGRAFMFAIAQSHADHALPLVCTGWSALYFLVSSVLSWSCMRVKLS